MSEQIKVGQRIRFPYEISCGPTDEHPALLFAKQGQLGRITAVGDCSEGYRATWDGWPTPFGIARNEFEPVDEP